MDCFKENICRLCSEVFCCVKCRCNHEKLEHAILPECDICVFGRVVLKQFSTDLLNHIEANHWPLHCLKCKRLFGSIDELLNHNKCLGGSLPNTYFTKKPAGILIRPIAELRYDSPPLAYDSHKGINNQDFVVSLSHLNIAATSTPTSKETNVNILREMKVTPTDDQKANDKSSRIGSTPDDSRKNEQSLKRRVTFCETPILEYSWRKKLLTTQKSESIEEEDITKPRDKTHDGNETAEPTGKALEISVSPLLGGCPVNYNSPPILNDGNKSIIAGSNHNMFLKTDNQAVTSTPMVNKENNKLAKNQILEEASNNESTNKEIIRDTKKTPPQNGIADHITSEECSPNYLVDNVEKQDEAIVNDLVTYQTPIMSAGMKQRQLKIAGKQFSAEMSSKFYSLSEVKQTPVTDMLTISKIKEERENLENELCDENHMEKDILIEETLWMSAVNDLNCAQNDNDQECDQKGEISEKLSVSVKKIIEVPHNIVTCIETDDESSNMDLSKSRLWTSMTQAIKSVVSGLSTFTKPTEHGKPSNKRALMEDDIQEEYEPRLKRMKITDLKCRRTIRAICPLAHVTLKIMVDKATQTD